MLSLGYAQAYAGQLDSAKQTFEKYGKQPGQGPNSLDSLGEAYFMNGADLLKAAHAHWLAGDLNGADAIAAKYLRDPWREASWYFSTGRRDRAIAKLQSAPDKQLIQRQVAVWNAPLPGDLAGLKTRYEHTPPSSDGEIRTFYAAALLKAGQKDEARKLATLWPLPLEQGVDPLFESLVFPTFLEVQKATK